MEPIKASRCHHPASGRVLKLDYAVVDDASGIPDMNSLSNHAWRLGRNLLAAKPPGTMGPMLRVELEHPDGFIDSDQMAFETPSVPRVGDAIWHEPSGYTFTVVKVTWHARRSDEPRTDGFPGVVGQMNVRIQVAFEE